MKKQIIPSNSYVCFLAPPTKQPASDHIKNSLSEYHITHLLGSGGFADVYEGTNSENIGVAIKVPQFKMGKTLDSLVLEKFALEADIWKKLNHKNIVKLYDSGPRPVPHIVMELMEGGDLEGLMKNQRLTVTEAVQIMHQILEGISYAHKMASVHRDLKPENILFTADGIVKITDWGIGKYMASEGITKTIETKGTFAYSAPEQFDSIEYGKIDWQTDIFQLGILFYEMLTGIKPYYGRDMAEVLGKVLKYEPKPPSSINPNIPTELDEIVMRALEKEKANRWESGGVMLHELKQLINGKIGIKKKAIIALKGKEEEKIDKKKISRPSGLQEIRIGDSRVYLLGTIKGLKSEEEKVKKAYHFSKPRVIGLHISSEEMKGLKAVIKGKIKKTGLSHGEEIYASNLAVFGEVQIPPPSLVIAYRMARSRNVPLAPLDMNEEEYTRNFTEKVSTFHLVSQSFRLKRLRKRSFNCPDAESFALAWDSAINRSKGYRALETERERRMAENIYYLAKEHARVLAVLEIERLPGIMKGISDMIER